MPDAQGPRRVPIREGLFAESGPSGQPMLIGSRCSETGQVFFPREVMNPVTMREGTMQEHSFAGDASLVAWTVVAKGLPGFDAPYAVAVAHLDAGPSMIAQLHGWQTARLRPGQRLALVVDRIRTEKDGTEVMGPKFEPVGD